MDDLNAIRLAEPCQFKKANIACDFACGGWHVSSHQPSVPDGRQQGE